MNILFVCNGNIFRSLVAEYCAKDYCIRNRIKDISISSAGIVANPEKVNPVVFNSLSNLNIDATSHRQKKLTAALCGKNDFIIAMARDNKQYLKGKYGVNSTLFNKVCYGRNTSVKDVDGIASNKGKYVKKIDNHIKYVVKYIHYAMPHLFSNISNVSSAGNSNRQGNAR